MSNTLHSIFKKGKPYALATRIPELVLPNQPIGIEIELEDFAPSHKFGDEFMRYWQIKDEPSLRSKPGKRSLEFIFVDGLYGRDLLNALNVFETELSKTKFTNSWRCGLHSHMDVSDLTPEQLLAFIFYNILFQDALYHYVGPERLEGPFCLPISSQTDTSVLVGRLYKAIFAEPKLAKARLGRELYSVIHEWNKYNGLNLHPIELYGTAEYRHPPAMTKADDMLRWVNIIMSFKQAALNLDNEDLRSFHTYVSKYGTRTIAQLVFGEYLPYLTYEQFHNDVFHNLRIVQDIILGTNEDKILANIRESCNKVGLRNNMEELVKCAE